MDQFSQIEFVNQSIIYYHNNTRGEILNISLSWKLFFLFVVIERKTIFLRNTIVTSYYVYLIFSPKKCNFARER